MKSASSTLRAYLSTHNVAYVAELIQITLSDGTVLRWTTWDADLLGYSADGPVISYQGGALRQTAGAEVSTVDIELGVSDEYRLPNGRSLPAAAAAGDFDGAAVEIKRLFMGTPGSTALGAILWFTGVVGPIRPASTGVTLTVNSRLEQLNQKLPRRVFSPSCPFALYDSSCGLAKTYVSASVVEDFMITSLAIVRLSVAQGNYLLGSVEFLTGPCAGQHRTVAQQSLVGSDTQLQFNVPLPSRPVAGDQVRLLAGCDKSIARCTEFNNRLRFGGFPFVPKPESVR